VSRAAVLGNRARIRWQGVSRLLPVLVVALSTSCSWVFPFDAGRGDSGTEIPEDSGAADPDGGDAADADDADAGDGCFRDDFENGSIDARWRTLNEDDAVSVAEQGGELVLTLTPSVAGYNGLVASSIDLSAASSVEVFLEQSASQAGFVETMFAVDPAPGHRYLFQTGANNFMMRAVLGDGTNVDTELAWDPGLFHGLRIRHDRAASSILFETRADGADWVVRKTAAVATSLAAAEVQLVAGAWSGENAAPGEAHFDDFRVVTPTCP